MHSIKMFQLKVPVLFTQENDLIIAYCPALDISSCGETATEAKKQFSNAVSLFLEELEEMGTLDQVLQELGWQKQESKRNAWLPPKLLKEEDINIKIPICA